MKTATITKRQIGGIEALILGLKASGGYKFREQIQLQDGLELDTFVAGAEQKIRFLAYALTVAEQMMQEPAPSIHPRWGEYQDRLRRGLQPS